MNRLTVFLVVLTGLAVAATAVSVALALVPSSHGAFLVEAAMLVA